MSHRRLIDKIELCRKMGVEPTWFARHDNRKRLKAAGFPEPVPGFGKRWDERAVDAWLDRVGGLAPATIVTKDLGVGGAAEVEGDPIHRAQAVLRHRLAEMGGRA